jgi:hypothetical protein
MFHKIAVTPFRSSSSLAASAHEVSRTYEVRTEDSLQQVPRLTLVPSAASGGRGTPEAGTSAFFDFISVSAHRCSGFFAEAAVLVLVLALLDRFMLKGRMEIGWVVSAFSISLALLAASIATDFSARRWLKRH